MSEGQSVQASTVTTTHYVLPGEGNVFGNVFGGHVCAWLDLACATAAMRHSRRPVVTASMDELVFHAPIKVGHIATVVAQVNAVFRTSMEIGAEVWSEDPLTGEKNHTTTAYLTFVALDENGKPAPGIPPLICQDEKERAREKAAYQRRAERLARRKHSS